MRGMQAGHLERGVGENCTDPRELPEEQLTSRCRDSGRALVIFWTPPDQKFEKRKAPISTAGQTILASFCIFTAVHARMRARIGRKLSDNGSKKSENKAERD